MGIAHSAGEEDRGPSCSTKSASVLIAKVPPMVMATFPAPYRAPVMRAFSYAAMASRAGTRPRESE